LQFGANIFIEHLICIAFGGRIVLVGALLDFAGIPFCKIFRSISYSVVLAGGLNAEF
jgi:hypothetical protein